MRVHEKLQTVPVTPMPQVLTLGYLITEYADKHVTQTETSSCVLKIISPVRLSFLPMLLKNISSNCIPQKPILEFAYFPSLNTSKGIPVLI